MKDEMMAHFCPFCGNLHGGIPEVCVPECAELKQAVKDHEQELSDNRLKAYAQELLNHYVRA